MLEVLGRCHLHVEAGLELEPRGLVQQLLVSRPTRRTRLDVDIVLAAAQRPPGPSRELLGGHLDRRGVGLSVDALARVCGPQRPREPLQVAAVRRRNDRDRAPDARLASNRVGGGADQDMLDVVRIEPPENGDPFVLEVLEALRGVCGPRVDARGRCLSSMGCVSPRPVGVLPRRC